jgi:hypothetical protein
VGQLALLGLNPDSSIGHLLPGLLAAGAANGVLNAVLGCQAVACVPAERVAMGSGANNTARYLGSAIGLTVVTVLVTHAGAASGAAGLVSGWNIAVLVTVGFSLLGALAVFLARECTAGSDAFELSAPAVEASLSGVRPHENLSRSTDFPVWTFSRAAEVASARSDSSINIRRQDVV